MKIRPWTDFIGVVHTASGEWAWHHFDVPGLEGKTSWFFREGRWRYLMEISEAWEIVYWYPWAEQSPWNPFGVLKVLGMRALKRVGVMVFDEPVLKDGEAFTDPLVRCVHAPAPKRGTEKYLSPAELKSICLNKLFLRYQKKSLSGTSGSVLLWVIIVLIIGIAILSLTGTISWRH